MEWGKTSAMNIRAAGRPSAWMQKPRAVLLAIAVSGLTGFQKSAVAAPAPAPSTGDPTIAQTAWKPPRNAFGQPDLSGYWTNATLTPLTRNRAISDRPTFTPAEAKHVEGVFANFLAQDNEPTAPDATSATFRVKDHNAEVEKIRPDFGGAEADVGGYNSAWLDPGGHFMEVNGELRTSILTTPDGQAPLAKNGRRVGRDRSQAGEYGAASYDNYEDRSYGERCIMGFGRNAGPPMLSNGYYNNDYFIIQTPDTIAIQVEMIHDVRVIRLKGGHRTDGIRPLMGDSIGHWEGATLVVETTNFPAAQAFFGAWMNLKVTERFTRISPTRINYRFQVEDPDTWDHPWGGEYDFSPMKGIIYEYACHEGNYALPGILAGARRREREAARVNPAQESRTSGGD